MNDDWADTVNSLIDAYKRTSPLVITRTNPGTYSTSALTTSGDAANTTLYVEGAIVPKSYNLAELPEKHQTTYSVEAYIKAKDTSGNSFLPQVGDIVTAEQDYRVAQVSIIQVGSVYQGFILDLSK